MLTAERPRPTAGRTQYVPITPMTSTQFGVAPSIPKRSSKITAEGEQVAEKALPRNQPLTWDWDETFDIGLDTGTPVDDKDYQVPFAFTVKLGKITFDLGQSSVSREAIKKMMKELSRKRDR